jgi:hypothetical protein
LIIIQIESNNEITSDRDSRETKSAKIQKKQTARKDTERQTDCLESKEGEREIQKQNAKKEERERERKEREKKRREREECEVSGKKREKTTTAISQPTTKSSHSNDPNRAASLLMRAPFWSRGEPSSALHSNAPRSTGERARKGLAEGARRKGMIEDASSSL